MNIKTCSLKPLVSYYDLDRPLDWEKLFGKKAPVEVEIGFGMGEVLVRSAIDNPDRNFIGIEQHWERIYKTLKRITSLKQSSSDKKYLDNVRIVRIDARIAFERLIPQKYISRVLSLFPCPWPKKGHAKHRLFSKSFLRLINSRLKQNGELNIVTDYEPFFNWILEEIKDTGFNTKTQKIKSQFNTKFERKWRNEGQEEFYELNMVKNRHVHFPVYEDVPMKSYKIKDFNPDKLNIDDIKGEVTVVFKDQLYDEKKKTAILYLIVSEENLTQHFRVVITHHHDHWILCKADGQKFFPTPGIARALEVVYESAKKTCA